MKLSLTSLVSVLTAVLQLTEAAPVPQLSEHSTQLYKRGWDYEAETIKGVNLGGWFVLEPFITPSLFEAFGFDESQIPVDEYHYTQRLGKELAQSRLEQHWASWYSEDDFASIAGTGLNMVRIPIGYWAFRLLDNDPYVQGQTKYLDQALEWCRKYNLKVWIDIHGAPGSQNGFDNSGLRDHYDFQKDSNIAVLYEVLGDFFGKYAQPQYDDVIIGLEVLNEPLGSVLDMAKLNDFWAKGYEILRETSLSQNYVIHDAFTAAHYFDDKFLNNQGFYSVVVDHHHYQVFSTGELQRSIDEHVSVACEWGSEAVSEYHWNLCGEWSAALTDCAKWLNGVGKGARYDGTIAGAYIGSCEGSQDITTWSEDKKDTYRRYIEAQLDAFEKRGGWIFWAWKTETALEWDFQKLFYHSIFPVPLTSRKFGNQCS
ncbi:hypothetical protein WICPIJ_007151 [Wickerhamomyces pijperi]|uniref:glucan 1,3-beta-glucosidase n=1 Tax=Wickerhamomyces pijperi TaxID=599730 RepID=A0A9P8TKN8_WICPI|nr:hypothetical protein WICPIJ_007151 [Wickerhamomyces pijperi]